MNTQELKMILDMIREVGGEAQLTFFVWLVLDKLPIFIFMMSALLVVAYLLRRIFVTGPLKVLHEMAGALSITLENSADAHRMYDRIQTLQGQAKGFDAEREVWRDERTQWRQRVMALEHQIAGYQKFQPGFAAQQAQTPPAPGSML